MIQMSMAVIAERRMSETPKKRKLLSNRVRKSRRTKRRPTANKKEQSICNSTFTGKTLISVQGIIC
jgi:TFIIF-interacting CTD phosphatase-like protein